MTMHPVYDSRELADALKAASLPQLATELARRCRTYAEMSEDVCRFAQHETDKGRLEQYAASGRGLADSARQCFEMIRAAFPDSQEARDALGWATKASDARLMLRVLASVAEVRKPKVVA